MIETKETSLFKTFRNIVYGKIISIAISGLDNVSEIKQHFNHTRLFLDTNVIFNMLGFRGKETLKITNEFVTLAKEKRKFSFYVFDFTVDEIIRVVSKYDENSHLFFSDVPVDSIYCYLKSIGWKRSSLSNFIQNIESKLAEIGIKIHPTKEFNKDKSYEDRYSKLVSYKPDKSQISYMHDLQAIYEIKMARARRIGQYEKAKCFFLTHDAKLTRYNFEEFGHKGRNSVPEIILEQTLTNLLWLKEPKDIPMSALISYQKSHAIVEKDVWFTFYDKLQSSSLTDKEFYNDTTTLICHNQLHSTLVGFDEGTAEDVIETTIKARAKLLRSQDDLQKEALLKKQKVLEESKSKIEQELRTQIAQIQAEKSQSLSKMKNQNIEALIESRGSIIDSASKLSNRLWNIFRGVGASVVIILGIIFMPKVCNNWTTCEPVFYVISIVVTVIIFLFGCKLSKLKVKFDEYIKKRKLKEANFVGVMKKLNVNNSDLNEEK